MPQKPDVECDANHIIICDANLVVMMTLFKPLIMFGGKFSLGKVVVHKSVIDEIESWKKPGHQKLKKFGEQILDDILGWLRLRLWRSLGKI
jgi:hypothetical protein